MVELSNAASVDIFLERFVNMMILGCHGEVTLYALPALLFSLQRSCFLGLAVTVKVLDMVTLDFCC